jgi:hypothetical protein
MFSLPAPLNVFAALGEGLGLIAQNIFGLGNWLRDAVKYFIDMVRNIFETIWNNFITWLRELPGRIGGLWNSFARAVNAWFTSLLKRFREKLVMTITADIAISGMWKSGERLIMPQRLNDVFYGAIGLVAAPVVGGVIGHLIDAIIPMPSTENYPLIPEMPTFEYIPPFISIPPAVPEPKPSLRPAYLWYPQGAGLPFDLPLYPPSIALDWSLSTVLTPGAYELRPPSIGLEREVTPGVIQNLPTLSPPSLELESEILGSDLSLSPPSIGLESALQLPPSDLSLSPPSIDLETALMLPPSDLSLSPPSLGLEQALQLPPSDLSLGPPSIGLEYGFSEFNLPLGAPSLSVSPDTSTSSQDLSLGVSPVAPDVSLESQDLTLGPPSFSLKTEFVLPATDLSLSPPSLSLEHEVGGPPGEFRYGLPSLTLEYEVY